MGIGLTNTTFSRYILSWLFLIIGILGVLAQNEESYERLLKLKSEALYEKGISYRNGGIHLDSSLVCFTILGDRGINSKEEYEHELSIKAYAEMAYIWFFHYYDYSKAIENMAKAKELMDNMNMDLPIYHLYSGLIYGSISHQSKDAETSATAMKHLRHAFNLSVASGETHIVNVVFSNMMSLAYSMDMFDSIAMESVRLRKMADNIDEGPEAYYTFFNLHTMDGLKALSQKRHDDALKEFDMVTDRLPNNEVYSRYCCGAWEFKGFAYTDAGRFPEAEVAFKTALDIANEFDLRDAKIEIFYDLADLYKKWKRPEDHFLYQANYLNLKDSLLSFRQISSMDEIRFIGDLRKVENKLKETGLHNERMRRSLIAVGVVLILTVIGIWFAIWFIRKLKRTTRSLYAKNQEVFKAQEEERALRIRYEKEIADLRDRLGKPEVTPVTVQKYKGSNLTEEAKCVIADKIRDIFENSAEIYSPGFSSDKLAELVGENYKYISQVINEKWGLNFNQLLNRYRIREACNRLMDRERYGHLTFEALAASVGFNSRSTFAAQFKAVTGLTPSQYISESKK